MLKTILGVSGREYTRVVPALFAYLFDRIDMEKFIAYVGDPRTAEEKLADKGKGIRRASADRKEGTRLKDIARVNGYILKNCKLYAYACYCARLKGDKLPTPRSYEVDAFDAKILRRLNLKHLSPKEYRPFTLKEFDFTVNSMVTSAEIRNNVGKFVSKKMSFLMKSYGESREDIEAYLKEMAIIAVYKQYPRYVNYLHFVNVAKAQIHNKGHSFITSSTCKSRQKLVRNGDGSFDAAHVALDTLNELEAPASYGIEIKERLQALASIEHKLPERTREFLLCAAGQYHEGFSEFLKCGNDDAVDNMTYPKYMDQLQDYFKVTAACTEKLFTNIRKHIHKVNAVP